MFRRLSEVVALVAAGVGLFSLGESIWVAFFHLWHGDGLVLDVNFVFCRDLFTLLVFADLLVLLAAYRYSSEFSLIFRNAGFAISTILLRLSMSVPRPWDVGVAVTHFKLTRRGVQIFGPASRLLVPPLPKN